MVILSVERMKEYKKGPAPYWKPAPSLKESKENYFFLVRAFCRAAICLLIEAINLTIAASTSAFETAPSATVYPAVADVFEAVPRPSF